MEVLLAIVVGVLSGTGVHLVLQPGLPRLAMGLSLLTTSVNLLVFTAAGVTRGAPALVAAGASRPARPFADPLPQALVLTAIVITFGVQAFALTLVERVARETGSDAAADLPPEDEDDETPEAPAP